MWLTECWPTIDRFRLRWKNYKFSQRIASEVCTFKQNYFRQHFLSENHHGLLEDCEIRLTLYCIMLKNGQTYFKNLAVFTPQDF